MHLDEKNHKEKENAVFKRVDCYDYYENIGWSQNQESHMRYEKKSIRGL